MTNLARHFLPKDPLLILMPPPQPETTFLTKNPPILMTSKLNNPNLQLKRNIRKESSLLIPWDVLKSTKLHIAKLLENQIRKIKSKQASRLFRVRCILSSLGLGLDFLRKRFGIKEMVSVLNREWLCVPRKKTSAASLLIHLQQNSNKATSQTRFWMCK